MGLAWVFLVVFAVAAVANWWTRWTENRRVEVWSKPLALIALIGVALAIDPVDPAMRAWFVVALICSLAGDVFLLDDRRFVFGLAAFLLGHLAYTAGFIAAEDWRWWAFAITLGAMTALAATIGRRIVTAARRDDPALGAAVVAYLVIISSMAVTAAAAGNAWAIGGAGLFVMSDTILGWRRFVGSKTWMPVAIMVTYHLGQAGLTLSLVHG